MKTVFKFVLAGVVVACAATGCCKTGDCAHPEKEGVISTRVIDLTDGKVITLEDNTCCKTLK